MRSSRLSGFLRMGTEPNSVSDGAGVAQVLPLLAALFTASFAAAAAICETSVKSKRRSVYGDAHLGSEEERRNLIPRPVPRAVHSLYDQPS